MRPRSQECIEMFVGHILPRARDRLATIEVTAPVRDVAEMMATPHTDLVVVCDGGVMAGVVTKTDIVAQLSRCPVETGVAATVDTIMTRDVASCRAVDALADVWRLMQARGLQRIPVLDPASRPIGVVYTRDALESLLRDVEIEDELLRNYVAGVGYQ
jgi:CBS domain-containing protein